MNAFSAAVDAIFADPNMAADAVWRDQGVGQGNACRVIRKSPDDITDFGGGRIRSETTVIDVRVSDWPSPREEDRVEIGGEWFRVQGRPVRDRERLVWTIDLRPA